jgi:hypothetical protein
LAQLFWGVKATLKLKIRIKDLEIYTKGKIGRLLVFDNLKANLKLKVVWQNIFNLSINGAN